MLKFSYLLCCFSFLLSGILVMVGYNAVQQTCGRPVLSAELRAKIKAKKDRIMREYETEQLNISTADGLNLSGLLVKRKQAKYTLLACHGYYLGKESMAYCLEVFPDAHILLLDFRAHGESEGNLTTYGLAESQDIKAAVSCLKENKLTAKLPLIAIGFSMGGALLLGALSQGVQLDAVILDSCFADLRVQMDRHFSRTDRLTRMIVPIICQCFFWFAGVDVDAVSPVKWIQDIQTPLFIIHSRNDKTTFEQDAHKLHAAAPCSQLWLVDGSAHGSIRKDYPQQYRQKIAAFIHPYITSNPVLPPPSLKLRRPSE